LNPWREVNEEVMGSLGGGVSGKKTRPGKRTAL
jgi:hypothetical protein